MQHNLMLRELKFLLQLGRSWVLSFISPPVWWSLLMKPESVKDQIPLKFIILAKEGT